MIDSADCSFDCALSGVVAYLTADRAANSQARLASSSQVQLCVAGLQCFLTHLALLCQCVQLHGASSFLRWRW